MTPFARFKDQVQRNLVALISLFVAVTSLSYNTWRNEKSEFNRNQREASFYVLLHIGEFRELLYHLRYDPETVGDELARSGWVEVLAIRDLSLLLEPPIPDAAEALLSAWEDNWETITVKASGDAVEAELNNMRDRTLEMLEELD